MCGSRKTSVTNTLIQIRYSFKAIAPSTASGCAVFVFILLSIVLLGVTLLPMIFIYETDFTGLNNGPVNIGDNHGVTNISWGTWLACYTNATKTACTQRDWISNPYTFVIENSHRTQVTVQQLWPRVLFLQFIGVLFAVFIVLVLWVRVWWLNSQSGRTSYVDPGKGKVCTTANLLTASLWVWITIVMIANILVLKSIQDEMKNLGTGVNTTPALGFWLPVAANGFILITVVLTVLFIKHRFDKSKEITTIQETKTQIT